MQDGRHSQNLSASPDQRQSTHPTPSEARQDVILATATAGGTIAAVRNLAQAGLKVSVVSSEPLSAAAWSRFAAYRYKAPREKQTEPFLKRLMDIGKESPGKVLLPTSDETAWLYASNAAMLAQYFVLRMPSVETMRRILDKNLLAEAAEAAGVGTLPTWQPRTLDELISTAPDMLYPILIKPRTQVHRGRKDKGAVAYSSEELIEKYRVFLDREYLTTESPELPESMVPLLQHFVDTRVEGVVSVSGYINETGDLFVTRRARKILQRSLPAGVGVCFESLGPDQELSDCARRLCKNLGYFGIFEVEFLRSNGSWAVIDFNPRLFNQAGMDALRGMPLAYMAYLDAAGKVAELRSLVAQAQEEKNPEAVSFDRFTLWAILTVKTLLRRTRPDERKYWSDWRKQHRSHSVDFAAAPGDFAPGIVHILSEISFGLRSLRRFFRATHQALPHAQHLAPKEPA